MTAPTTPTAPAVPSAPTTPTAGPAGGADGGPGRTGAPATLAIRTDAAGRPVLSGTFVLAHLPRPDERLGPLVQHGSLAFEVEVRGVPVEAPVGAPVDSLLVELRDGERTLAAVTTSGPFLHAGLSVELDGVQAEVALRGLLGEPTSLSVRAELRHRPEPVLPTRIEVDVAAAWRALDSGADPSRSFLVLDLDNYLATLLRRGAVRVLAGPDDPDRVRAAFLRAMAPVLDPDLVLTPVEPGPLTVTTVHGGGVAAARITETTVPLADLLGPAPVGGTGEHLHLLALSGGELVPVPPVRTGRPRGSLTDRASLHLLDAGKIVGLSTVLRPEEPPRPLPIRPEALGALHDRPQVLALGTLVVADQADRRPGPLVGQVDAALWMDRWDATKAWYLPSFALVAPEPTQVADEAPFRYELRPDVGHRPDGTQGLVATITTRLRPERSAATAAALEAADYATVTPVPLTSVSVQLAIPFRDTDGTAQVELVTADLVEPEGPLGAEGSSLVVTFRLLDDWARSAYGSLSTPGFQARPCAVVVSATFEGWREQGRRPVVLGLDKRWALTAFRTRGPEQPRPAAALLASPVTAALLTASIRPAWQFRPELLERLEATSYGWQQLSASTGTAVSVPCASFGQLYREWRDEAWHDLGCRPTLQLGVVVHRTHEPVEVAAAEGFATIYRSLQSPGRFLVVPRTYAVGRYDAADTSMGGAVGGVDGRAYRPRMTLHSTVDDEDPTEITCVLSAALEPVLPPYVRAAILAELRTTAHPEPTLVYLGDLGVGVDTRWAVPGIASVSCVAVSTGFEMVLTTDLAGFITVRSLITGAGLSGVADAVLPGDVRLSADLKVGLADVTGPFRTGPLEIRAEGEDAVLTNRTGQRCAVRALHTAGAHVVDVDAVLAPGEEVRCDRKGVDASLLDAVFVPDRKGESLDEIRAYIEDLEVGVLFVSVADPAEHGLAGLEIRTSFQGREDPTPLLLTTETRDAERSYVLPLTTFAEDPVLQFTVVAVGADGSRQEAAPVSWRVRSQGALVPVGPPG